MKLKTYPPTPTPTPIVTPTHAPTLTPTPPGFEATFAIAGLLAMAYLLRGRNETTRMPRNLFRGGKVGA